MECRGGLVPAAASAAEGLCEDASCSICMECFWAPVTIPACGHTFCLACLARYMQQEGLIISCPRCRQRFRQGDLKPNRELAAIAQVCRQLKPDPAKPPRKGVCQGHPVKKRGVCPVCWDTQGSRCGSRMAEVEGTEGHEPTPDLLKCREALQAALSEVFEQKCYEEENIGFCQNLFKSQREKIELEFEGLRKFLEEEERLALSRLDELEKQILKKIQGHLTKLEEQSSSLKKLITEMEGTCQQPNSCPTTSSKTIIKSFRFKGVDFQKVEVQFPVWEKHMKDLYQQHFNLQKVMSDFKEWRWARTHAVDVTIAPETAHPCLILSEDWKSVRDGDTTQEVPRNPERFDYYTIALGCERFSSGRHYWEVEVGYKSDWGLGVCNECANRKGRVTLLPVEGYWVVRLRDGVDYQALDSSVTQITPRTAPRAVGIFLDYEVGKVSFYNAEDQSHLFTFHDTFTKTLRPLFSPGVIEKGRNAGSLRIRLVTRW